MFSVYFVAAVASVIGYEDSGSCQLANMTQDSCVEVGYLYMWRRKIN